jgi:hypothetical protein
VIGAGKKFMSIYDLNKTIVKSRIKCMDKKYISSIKLLNQNEIISGQFQGEIEIVDIRDEKVSTSFKVGYFYSLASRRRNY